MTKQDIYIVFLRRTGLSDFTETESGRLDVSADGGRRTKVQQHAVGLDQHGEHDGDQHRDAKTKAQTESEDGGLGLLQVIGLGGVVLAQLDHSLGLGNFVTGLLSISLQLGESGLVLDILELITVGLLQLGQAVQGFSNELADHLEQRVLGLSGRSGGIVLTAQTPQVLTISFAAGIILLPLFKFFLQVRELLL